MGVMCQRLHVLPHNIRYVVARLGLKPIARAGAAMIYSDAQVEQIAAELERIKTTRRIAS